MRGIGQGHMQDKVMLNYDKYRPKNLHPNFSTGFFKKTSDKQCILERIPKNLRPDEI